jgi:hypothetical protein
MGKEKNVVSLNEGTPCPSPWGARENDTFIDHTVGDARKEKKLSF